MGGDVMILSDEQIAEICADVSLSTPCDITYARAIEAAVLAELKQEPVAKVCTDLPGNVGWNPNLTELPAEGAPLYTHPQPTDEVAKDAERYRYIRSGEILSSSKFRLVKESFGCDEYLDRAIDAAMKGGE